MGSQSKNSSYSRLNTRMQDYVAAVNAGADPEELHNQLRHLIEEAITVDITLAKLLQVLASSHLAEGDSQKFTDHISKHYARGEDSARVKRDTAEKRNTVQSQIGKNKRD